MGTAIGHVVCANSRIGLAGLTISLDLNLGDPWQIGSGLTDQNGNFRIDWPHELFVEAEMFVITVRLLVAAPETDGLSDPVIFRTKPRTIMVTATEAFAVEIPSDVLDDYGIDRPEAPPRVQTAVSAITANAAAAQVLDEQWAATAKDRVDARRSRQDSFENTFKSQLLQEISFVPDELADNAGFVVEGDPQRSVRNLTKTLLADGATKISSATTTAEGAIRRTRYFLTDNQKSMLDGILTSGDVLDQETLDSVLRHGEVPEGTPKPTELTREDDLFERFLQQTFDETCAGEALAPSEQHQENNGEQANAEADPVLTPEEIDRQLYRVTSGIDAPVSQLSARPGQDDVISNIRGFGLPPGPADTPAFFDFHKLNIAFDHVWREFLDDRIEPFARGAYMAVTDLGGDPVSAMRSGNRTALRALEDEAELVQVAEVGKVPRQLYAQNLSNQTFRLGSGVDWHFGDPSVYDLGPRLVDGSVGSPSVPTASIEFRPGGPGDPVPDPLSAVTTPGIRQDYRPGGSAEEMYDPISPPSVIQRLRQILNSRYSFTAFGADAKSSAINFGVVITYRQRWEPVTYQVGELARTITLAPGESKSYTQRTKITRKRSEKEVEKNSSIRRDEFETTTRAEAEIIRKAQAKTNFQLTAEGTYNFGIASGDSTTTTEHDAENASDDAKKSFREAVVKASQEYKQERSLEITTEEEGVFEIEDKSQISNPNNELTVTYLFFELQRRFRVSERIHKATPVVLVARKLPRPNEIDEAFLIRYGWIIKRALLDDMFEATISYVAGPMAGDKVARDALYTAMQNHLRVVNDLKDDLKAMKEQASEGYESLRRAVEARIESVSAEESDGLFADLAEFAFGGGENTETAQLREEAAREHEQRAVEQVKQLTMALQREVTAYTEATDKYTKAQKKHKEWELRIVDLLLHVKENIIHYMQFIWASEHQDQRFLRLHMKAAPAFVETDGGATYTFLGYPDQPKRERVLSDGTIQTLHAAEFEFKANFSVQQEATTLAQSADMDKLLGFKGNYMIFPLKDSNPLTDYMLTPYIDAGFRLLDPDDKGNISREDFARYVCYLRDTLDDEQFEAVREELLERYRQLILSDPVHGDEIIVPSGSAYIEALPGANPLLENFKLAHRAIDVINAQEETRASTIDNIRRAARVLGDDLEDPDIDAKYQFEGDANATVVSPSPPDNDDGS